MGAVITRLVLLCGWCGWNKVLTGVEMTTDMLRAQSIGLWKSEVLKGWLFMGIPPRDLDAP